MAIGVVVDQAIPKPDHAGKAQIARQPRRSEEHTSELQSLMRISYAVFCLKKKKTNQQTEKISVTKDYKKIDERASMITKKQQSSESITTHKIYDTTISIRHSSLLCNLLTRKHTTKTYEIQHRIYNL